MATRISEANDRLGLLRAEMLSTSCLIVVPVFAPFSEFMQKVLAAQDGSFSHCQNVGSILALVGRPSRFMRRAGRKEVIAGLVNQFPRLS